MVMIGRTHRRRPRARSRSHSSTGPASSSNAVPSSHPRNPAR
jgi:hypothetical protein